MHYVFVPKTIREWRKLQNASPERVAVHMGCARMTVINWERGLTTPNVDDLCGLADFFGVTIDQFFAKKQGDYGSTHSRKFPRNR